MTSTGSGNIEWRMIGKILRSLIITYLIMNRMITGVEALFKSRKERAVKAFLRSRLVEIRGSK